MEHIDFAIETSTVYYYLINERESSDKHPEILRMAILPEDEQQNTGKPHFMEE